MPIYEYRCTACHRISEEWVRSHDAPDTEPCPHCGAVSQRILSNTSFQLKGTGWYVTEYGGHKNAPSESGEAAAGSTAAADSAPAADSASGSAGAASPAEAAPAGEPSPAPKTEAKADPQPASKATAA